MTIRGLWDRWLRAAFERAHGMLGALGIFVVAGLVEAIQRFAIRRAPQILDEEKAAPGGGGP